MPLAGSQAASSSSGIDLVLSGHGFVVASPMVESVECMSAIDVLEKSESVARCKFQGVLAVCDDSPRDVTESHFHDVCDAECSLLRDSVSFASEQLDATISCDFERLDCRSAGAGSIVRG